MVQFCLDTAESGRRSATVPTVGGGRNIRQRFVRAEMIGLADGFLPFGADLRLNNRQFRGREPVRVRLMEPDEDFQRRAQFREGIRAR